MEPPLPLLLAPILGPLGGGGQLLRWDEYFVVAKIYVELLLLLYAPSTASTPSRMSRIPVFPSPYLLLARLGNRELARAQLPEQTLEVIGLVYHSD